MAYQQTIWKNGITVANDKALNKIEVQLTFLDRATEDIQRTLFQLDDDGVFRNAYLFGAFSESENGDLLYRNVKLSPFLSGSVISHHHPASYITIEDTEEHYTENDIESVLSQIGTKLSQIDETLFQINQDISGFPGMSIELSRLGEDFSQISASFSQISSDLLQINEDLTTLSTLYSPEPENYTVQYTNDTINKRPLSETYTGDIVKTSSYEYIPLGEENAGRPSRETIYENGKITTKLYSYDSNGLLLTIAVTTESEV